jgi:hypothetical protein
MCCFGAAPAATAQGVNVAQTDSAPELDFPPQYPFSWTLRGARDQRLRTKRAPTTRYSIAGSARSGNEIAAAVAFCAAHNAKLELR